MALPNHRPRLPFRNRNQQVGAGQRGLRVEGLVPMELGVVQVPKAQEGLVELGEEAGRTPPRQTGSVRLLNRIQLSYSASLRLTVETDQLTRSRSGLALIILLFLLFLCLSLPLAPSQFVPTGNGFTTTAATPTTRKGSHTIFHTHRRRLLLILVIVSTTGVSSWIPPIGQLTRFGKFDRFIGGSDGCDPIVR